MFSGLKQAAGLLTVGIVLILGCSGQIPGSAARSDSSPALEPAMPPQAAAQAVLDSLKASKPAALWDILASDQQVAINTAVHELAEAMDPDVWDHTVRNLKKLVRVLETKKDFVLDSPWWRTSSSLKLADVKARWVPAVGILKTIVGSELVDLPQMKKFDGRAFLEGTGATLYAETHELFRSMKDDRLKRLEDMQVSVKDTGDRTATVVLRSPDPKAKPIEIVTDFSEGKWIVPQLSFVTRYVLKKVPAYLNLFKPYGLADWKDQYVKDMDRLEKALDQLEVAKTSDEFQAVVGREIFPVVLARIAQFRKGPPTDGGLKATSYSRNATTALVLVQGKHSPGEPSLDALMARLNGAVPPPDSVSFPKTIERMTVILVDPVGDINAFAKTIDVGKITQVDAKRKTVIVELPSSAAKDKANAPANAQQKPASAAK
jgi:hypothetical protein